MASILRHALAVLLLAGCSPAEQKPTAPEPPQAEQCVLRRAAYDIGSATTKMKVAEIDRCLGRILRVLVADDVPVFYRDDVNIEPPAFKPETMERGLSVLRDLSARAAEYRPESSAGVATAAFRRAGNASELVARIERELHIEVEIITQLQEARLGFVGAVTSAGVEPQRAVVWDVGGGSMQITSLRDDGHLLIYEGRFASGQMRDYVIRQVQAQPETVKSPNPIDTSQAGAACDYAADYAVREVPEELRKKLADERTVVVGIGALKYYGDVPAKEKGSSCTRDGLESKIDGLLGKSDAEIGGDYAGTAVSDRLLLLGFMRGLGIHKVVLADVDLTDGLLFEPEYWQAVR